ncbi:Esterase/lipase/thioesterase [Tricholoma furcatifolium]|nr:Esterase/lipase/thioesterase [Tricholoma furcatifolium]
MLTQLAALALAIPTVLAHGGVLSYSNAGNWYWGWLPYDSPVGQTTIQRPWYSYNPITDATDPTLACNDNGTWVLDDLQQTATVEAGSAITAYWNYPWPHPIGPMLTYLAECPGSTCTGVNSSLLQWFKIDEAGLINGTVYNGTWGDGVMIADNSSWTTTIPATVPSGSYLIRFETIALHSLPAQFYPECAQIDITGGGSLAPTAAELVYFPGGYSNDDPGYGKLKPKGYRIGTLNTVIPDLSHSWATSLRQHSYSPLQQPPPQVLLHPLLVPPPEASPSTVNVVVLAGLVAPFVPASLLVIGITG